MKFIPVVVSSLVLGSTLLFGAASTQAASKYAVAGIDREADVTTFLANLKAAVAHDNRKAVASLADYPMHISVQGKGKQIASPDQLIQHYPTIFTAKVKAAIARQQEKDLFVNWRGVMIGNGEIWFAPSDKAGHLKIIGVNN